MKLKKGNTYYIKDDYYNIIKDDNLIKNMHYEAGKRPFYFLKEDDKDEKILWLIPMTTQIERHQQEKKAISEGKIYINEKYENSCFLIGSAIPILEKYVDEAPTKFQLRSKGAGYPLYQELLYRYTKLYLDNSLFEKNEFYNLNKAYKLMGYEAEVDRQKIIFGIDDEDNSYQVVEDFNEKYLDIKKYISKLPNQFKIKLFGLLLNDIDSSIKKIILTKNFTIKDYIVECFGRAFNKFNSITPSQQELVLDKIEHRFNYKNLLNPYIENFIDDLIDNLPNIEKEHVESLAKNSTKEQLIINQKHNRKNYKSKRISNNKVKYEKEIALDKNISDHKENESVTLAVNDEKQSEKQNEDKFVFEEISEEEEKFNEISNKFNSTSKKIIRKAYRAGYDLDVYDNGKFDSSQLNEIFLGQKFKINTYVYADPKYRPIQMQYIRLALIDNLDYKIFMNDNYTSDHYDVFFKALKDGISLDAEMLAEDKTANEIKKVYEKKLALKNKSVKTKAK